MKGKNPANNNKKEKEERTDSFNCYTKMETNSDYDPETIVKLTIELFISQTMRVNFDFALLIIKMTKTKDLIFTCVWKCNSFQAIQCSIILYLLLIYKVQIPRVAP